MTMNFEPGMAAESFSPVSTGAVGSRSVQSTSVGALIKRHCSEEREVRKRDHDEGRYFSTLGRDKAILELITARIGRG